MPINGADKNHLEEGDKEAIHPTNKWMTQDLRESVGGMIKLRSVSAQKEERYEEEIV